jgi:hypothetical protein
MASSYDFDVIEINWDFKIGPVEAGPVMMESGWVGGLWMKINTCTSRRDGSSLIWKQTVEKATGDNAVGFVLRGSAEGTDQYSSFNPGKTGNITLCQQGIFLFKYYETGVYTLNCILYVSNNGLLKPTQDTVTSRGVGFCVALPADNENYLGASIVFPS